MSTPEPTGDRSDAAVTAETVSRVWREESARLVGALARQTRDLDLAEDLGQDALLAALQQWPDRGVPDNPGAWLATTAHRRYVDHVRRASTGRARTEQWAHAELPRQASTPELVDLVDPIPDDALRLVFLTCHAALTPDSRAALTLRLVAGLSTEEIARGFFSTPSTVGQRISRAKATVARAGLDLETPTGQERRDRLDDVRAVLSAIFTEGHTASSGEEWMRPDLATEAIRLTRMLDHLEPGDPDTLGLLALMQLQAARMPARLDEHGRPVLLEAQDRSRWDRPLLDAGLAALAAAERIAATGHPVGPFVLQAYIAAEHARAATTEATNWRRIASLYDLLSRAAPGAVVEVNRAVAHGRAHGPASGLAVLDAVPEDALGDSALLPSVRGDLLERLGRHDEAMAAFVEAAGRTRNAAERELLIRRAHPDGSG